MNSENVRPIDLIMKGYAKNGDEDTKSHLEKIEKQKQIVAANINKLAESGNPLAMLILGFDKEGKQNDKSNETKVDANNL